MENALITGATKGIGRAIALAFAKQGLNLAICSRNIKELRELKEQLLKTNPGISVVIYQADCSSKQQVLSFAGFAEQELGFISVLVNNVGSYEPSSIIDDSEDTFMSQVNTNLMPAYELYRYFGKTMMAARKGHIFNICSVAALQPVVNAGTYSVTKAALYSLNTVMRLEMRMHNVKVTAVLPGSTLTGSWQGTDIPVHQFVQPHDIAAAVTLAYNMSAGANTDEIVIKPLSGQL